MFKTYTSSDDYNTCCYCYMKMYLNLNTGTISKRKISPETVRSELEQSLIKNFVDMKESCLICGSDSNNIDMNWGECTNCKRWIHCVCGETTWKKLRPMKTFGAFYAEVPFLLCLQICWLKHLLFSISRHYSFMLDVHIYCIVECLQNSYFRLRFFSI